MNALLAPRPQRARLPIGFIVVALLFYAIDGTIAHSPIFLEKPDVLGLAISLDLTVVVTAAWWLMVVRRGRATNWSLVPVFVLSIAAAALTMPAGHRDILRDLRYLAIPFEIAVVGALALGVRKMPPQVAAVFETERAIFYYAFASWRKKPDVPAGMTAFSYHKKNGYAGILYTLARMSLVEMIALDFLIRVRSPHVANIVLAVDLFAALWLIGFARAVQMRPILVDSETLHLRMGLQWTLDVPRANIASMEFGRIKAPPKRTPGYLRMAPQPNAMLTLRQPLTAKGPYGMRREVTRVGLAIDQLADFERALKTA